MRPAKVLVVDDDPNMRLLLEYNLSRRGLAITTAKDGLEGFRLVRQQAFDMLILDILLPGLTGLEIAERLRQDAAYRDLPILLMTAASADDDMIGIPPDISADLLIKPFDLPRLADRIEGILASSTEFER